MRTAARHSIQAMLDEQPLALQNTDGGDKQPVATASTG